MRWWICRRANAFTSISRKGWGHISCSLFSDIDALLLYAGTHQQFSGYFRALSKRFPYAVYYRMSGETIQVWRVLDCRQRPSNIKKALR